MLQMFRKLGWGVALCVVPMVGGAQGAGGVLSRAQIAAYSTALPAAESADEKARRAFEAAYDAVGQPGATPTADPAILKAYPLYPYLEAARIEQALKDAPPAPAALAPADGQAEALIASHQGQPVARELRAAWLASLAQRSQWAAFLTHYPAKSASAALRCQQFTARIALGRTAALEPVIQKAWLTAHSLPACQQAFDWLQQRGALSADLIAQRARLALEADDPGFAEQLIAQLPPGPVAQELGAWVLLLQHPRQGIDRALVTPHETVENKALLAGWSLLARQHPRAALKRYWRLVDARHFTRESASPYALALALGLAWDRNAHALSYFRRVETKDFNPAAREWQVRAALWAGRWALALRAIAALPADDRGSSRWQYWKARAEQALHHRARAKSIYRSLLQGDDYYAALAAARLGRSSEPTPNALSVDPAVLGAIARLPAMVRARELFFCGLEHEADAEWRHAYGSLNASERQAAILLAARWGWYNQAIETAAEQHVFDDYSVLYPLPFETEVQAASRRTGLPAALVLGIIRQESLYQVDAVSPVGASGLMQLMPATAARTAQSWKLSDPDAAALFDPAVNIALGSAHLRTLVERFGGRIELAVAAYNAGTRAVSRWLPAKPVPGDIWIENIPYSETRAYVERVLWHTVVFTWRAHGAALSARSWLAPLDRAALALPPTARVAAHIIAIPDPHGDACGAPPCRPNGKL